MRLRAVVAAGLALLGGSGVATGQTVEIVPSWGYQYGGALDVERGRLSIPSAASFGVSVGVRVRSDAQVEFSYSRQRSELRFREEPLEPSSTLFEMAVEYYQVGGVLEWPRGAWRPFFGMMVGMARFDPEPSNIESEIEFAFGFEGGTKLSWSRHLGLRLQARLLVPWFHGGASLFCSTSGGRCLVSASGTAVAQGDASLGVVVGF